ncbi:NupC/NupG family nucleoside CNT transporter [Desulfotignum balticum]|uniref:NupC/NupG family nucleoside CNT transporter n=1 Tax=Desulfotignum balticum TaxID=115781 RepID=UPI0004136062|nr:nucleoside transporter C-terminal domain-containing protein [Desulfotignum balticum]
MIIQGVAGLIVFIGLAWMISENRGRVNIKTIAVGLGFQFLLALIFLKIPLLSQGFVLLNQMVLALEQATRAGTSMVFGYLGGGTLPFEEKFAGASFILAFQALPLVLLMSALSSLLFYWKILPWVVQKFSRVLEKLFKLGGAEGLGVSANIFVGMVESPLFIRPYVRSLTRSELFTLMTSGMATIAGTMMVLYANILGDIIPNVLGHILAASIISAPAAITVAKIMIPETRPVTSGELTEPDPATSSMDAVTRGTLQGVELLINIIAMLVVLVALVHLADILLKILPVVNGTPLTLQRIFGWIMSPVVWLMGVPWAEAGIAGGLMGTKTIINEFVAYLNLAGLPADSLGPDSRLIMLYAMCGFANPGSLGIMIGGLGTMAPERRGEIVSLGLKSIIAGTIATCMTGAIVGLLG